MIKINIPIFGRQKEELKSVEFGELHDYLTDHFSQELSEMERSAKKVLKDIEKQYIKTMELVKKIDKKGKMFTQNFRNIDVMKMPENVDNSTLANFMMEATRITNQINALSPTTKAKRKHLDDVKRLAGEVRTLIDEIKKLEKFIKENDFGRKLYFVEKEIENIKSKNTEIKGLMKEIKKPKKSVNTKEVDEKIQTIKKSGKISKYKELNEKMKDLDREVVEVKNKVSVLFSSIKRPIKKIQYKLEISVDNYLEFPLETIESQKKVDEILEVVRKGLDLIEKNELKCGKSSVDKLRNFQKTLNKNFVADIKKRLHEIESKKSSYKKEISDLSKVFKRIEDLEEERKKIQRITSKIDREISEKQSQIEKIRKDVEFSKKKLKNRTSELLGHKIDIEFSD